MENIRQPRFASKELSQRIREAGGVLTIQRRLIVRG